MMMESQNLLLQLLDQKTPEAWLSMLAGTIYVWVKSGNKSRVGKAIEAGLAGILSYSISPDIIDKTEYPATFVYFAVASFGFFVLDVLSSIIADKDELKILILGLAKKWLRITPVSDQKNK